MATTGPEIYLYQLLAGPLSALIRAQAMSAMTTLDYIEKVGFESDGSGSTLGQLRMVTFSYTKQTASGEKIAMSMQIPLLSLLPIPIMTVKESVLDFSVHISEVRQVGTGDQGLADSDSPAVGAAVGQRADLRPVEIVANYAAAAAGAATGGVGNESSDTHVKMHVTVVGSDFPAGISRLLNIMANTAIVDDGRK